MCFVLKYRVPIDSITANKVLKLRKYELDNEDWMIIEDLVDILEVGLTYLLNYCSIDATLHSNTRRLRFSSLATQRASQLLFRQWTVYITRLMFRRRRSIIHRY